MSALLYEVRCRWVDPSKPRARKVLGNVFVVAASSRDEAIELAKAEASPQCERWTATPIEGPVYALPSRMIDR